MKNLLKEKLAKGQNVIGTFNGFSDPYATEILSRMGFDWILIDGEHSPLGIETMQGMMQAMNGSGCTPLVRPQWNDMVIIKRVLDIGAQGVLVPWVNTKEEAEYAVQACKYPPQGLRGCGPRRAALGDPEYVKTANEETMVIVQIETAKAVNNVDDILSVKGVDGVYIGPFDLAMSFFGGPPQWDNPKYTGAFDKVVAAAKKHGKHAGMFAVKDNIEWAINKGFDLNTVDAGEAFLAAGAQASLAKTREAFKALAKK